MVTTDRKPILLDFEKPLAELEEQIKQIRDLADETEVDVTEKIAQLEDRATQLRKDIFSNLTPQQRLQVARHPRRPTTLDYIQAISDDWLELHGDRAGFDDLAMVGGVGCIDGRAVVMIGQQKGRNTKDNIQRNFGQASPSGYRKAIRLMEHADRFRMPILTFIDTPAAWAGIEAEEYGQGEAIAYNLREMFKFEVPIICTVVGEGGSGGALGIGVGDHLMMMEHSVYSVAPPEACAAILWRDAGKASKAAEALKITSEDLVALGIIDEVVREPTGAAHADPVQATELVKAAILKNLAHLDQLSPQQRRDLRYQKFRNIGKFTEVGRSG